MDSIELIDKSLMVESIGFASGIEPEVIDEVITTLGAYLLCLGLSQMSFKEEKNGKTTSIKVHVS